MKLGPVDTGHVVRVIHSVSVTSVMPHSPPSFQSPLSARCLNVGIPQPLLRGLLFSLFLLNYYYQNSYLQTCFSPMSLTAFWMTLLACFTDPLAEHASKSSPLSHLPPPTLTKTGHHPSYAPCVLFFFWCFLSCQTAPSCTQREIQELSLTPSSFSLITSYISSPVKFQS